MTDEPKPRTSREWLEDADRRFLDAVQRVMTAPTRSHAWTGSVLEWDDFRREMANLQHCAEERHAAKYYAVREAEISPAPFSFSNVLAPKRYGFAKSGRTCCAAPNPHFRGECSRGDACCNPPKR